MKVISGTVSSVRDASHVSYSVSQGHGSTDTSDGWVFHVNGKQVSFVEHGGLEIKDGDSVIVAGHETSKGFHACALHNVDTGETNFVSAVMYNSAAVFWGIMGLFLMACSASGVFGLFRSSTVQLLNFSIGLIAIGYLFALFGDASRFNEAKVLVHKALLNMKKR